VRVSVEAVADYSLSGRWRLLRRCRVQLRPRRAHRYSPDPEDARTVARLEHGVREAVRQPEEVVVVFLDELGYRRWPETARDWMPAAPQQARQLQSAGPTNRQQRIIGALNALTGQVTYWDHYLVGRLQVSALYRQLDQVYAAARRVYVVQDNCSIHHHADVAATLREVSRLEPVWLPTDAPWLHPIETLWHWLRRDVLKGHRLAADWPQLRQQVNAFLDQFAHGSSALLRSVGLIGDGHLAYVRSSP
jgi:hypothetical protein